MSFTGGSRSDKFGFRMPPGARIAGRQGETFNLSVEIPTDDDGFLGQQCPSCRALFRLDADDYEALPDDIELWCAYCGGRGDTGDFLTEQQMDRIQSAVGDLGEQIIGNALDEIFGGIARKSRSRPRHGFGIEVTYKSTPFSPKALPGIDEEALVRVRNCVRCSLRYAVFGEHRFCPSCGPLPSTVVAFDALAAETARLDAFAALPPPVAAGLREQGVFNRLWVDTLENLVGIVEVLAGNLFKDAVPDAALKLRKKGNIFQRLDGMAALFVSEGYEDLRTAVGDVTWSRLVDVWAIRHLFTHNDGIVDAKYVTKAPHSTAQLGQRLTVTDTLCRHAIADTEDLCRALSSLTDNP
jgi:hypothetical protein